MLGSLVIDFTSPKVFTNSELQLWQWCRQKWNYRVVERIRPIGYGPAYHLHLGLALHEALQAYYDPINLLSTGERDSDLIVDHFQTWHHRELEKAEEFLAKFQRNMTDEIKGKMNDAYDLGSHMLMGYRQWAKINDDFDVISVEQKFMIPMLDRRGNIIPGLYYAGRLDGLVKSRKTQKILVLETKSVSDTKVGHLPLDPQHSRYILAARQIFGLDVVGSWHNMLRKQRPGPRVRVWLFNREEVYRSEFELETVRNDMLTMIEEIVNAPILPSIRKECQYCEYFNLCVLRQEQSDPTRYIEQNFWTSPVEHEEIDYDDDFMTVEIEIE